MVTRARLLRGEGGHRAYVDHRRRRQVVTLERRAPFLQKAAVGIIQVRGFSDLGAHSRSHRITPEEQTIPAAVGLSVALSRRHPIAWLAFGCSPPTSLALVARGECLDLWCRHLKGSVNHPCALKQEIQAEVEAAGHDLWIVLAKK